MPAATDLESQLRRDEGDRAHVYQDSEGWWTIGIGRLVDKRKAGSGLRPHERAYLLREDMAAVEAGLDAALPWSRALSPARRGVLLNMGFQLGVAGLLKFRLTLELVRQGRYDEAAREMLRSRWASQTPTRAHRLARQMAADRWI